MTLTRNAIGNLINRYRAVLSKCRLLNTLGSLAVAGALVLGMGGAGVAADSGLNVSSSDDGHHWKPQNPNYTYQAGVGVTAGVASGGNVHIDNGKAGTRFYGGFADSGIVSNNSVTMTGGRASSVAGGGAYSATVIGNRVTVTGGTIGYVYGGNTDGGSVNNNTVTVTGGTITGDVYGGNAGSSSGSGSANNNRVTISGGTITGAVYGGRSATGNAIGNTVTISGGTIGHVVGGNAYGTGGNADNNTVSYSGGKITGTLWGGYGAGGSSNNTLVTIGKREVGGEVKWFQNYHFVVDANQNTGLTVTGDFTMDSSPNSNNIQGVDILGGASLPKEGDTLTLVDVGGTFTDKPITAGANGVGKKGATMLFDYYDVAKNSNKLEAKVRNVRVNPQAKALSEGVAANAALVNIGADAVAGAGMASALAASASNAPAGTTTLAPFGTMQAGTSRIETGSHVDVSGLNLIAGIALGQQTEFGRLLIGPFFEAGFGSYNTYNSFDNAASVNGGGTTNFLGVGILARFDLADIALGHPYLEGSFRFGHAFNSYSNHDLTDGAGNSADYDTDAPYQSFHVGLGYIFDLTETDHLDVYGKYFWSHLGSSDAKVVGDPVEFDDVHSSRLRFGGRYSHDFGTDKGYAISPYIGAAYEHEFDGKARATTYGRDIKAPTLKGDTGIGELGVTFKHQNGLSLDLGVNGYVGKRQGVTGNLMLKYEF